MKRLIALMTIASVLWSQTKVDYPTQIKRGPVVFDTEFPTLQQGCDSAAAGTAILFITKQWNNVPTTHCNTVVNFSGSSARIEPANGAVFFSNGYTAPARQAVWLVDTTGVVRFSGSGTGSAVFAGNFSTMAAACDTAAVATSTLQVNTPISIPATMTCAATVFAGAGGVITPSAGQVYTQSGPFDGTLQQHFNTIASGPGSVQLLGSISGGVPIIWFGADPTGVADPIAAMNAAYASGAPLIRVTNGTYNLQSAGWVQATTGRSVVCDSQGAVIQYTGSTLIDSVVLVGSPTYPYSQRFEGCTVKGNSHSTYTVHALRTNHSVISNLDLKGAITSFLFIDECVADTFEAIWISGASGAFTYVAVNGIHVRSSNTNVVIEPVIEMGFTSGSGSPTRGIYVQGGPGGAAVIGTTFIGGTSESNDTNVLMEVQTGTNLLLNMDNEAPCTANVVDGGGNDIISGGLFAGLSGIAGCSTTPPSVHYLSTAVGGKVSEILGDQIIVDAGAQYITIEGNDLGNNFGGSTTDILDSGTLTYISATNRHCCGAGAGQIPGKIPGNNTLGTSGTPLTIKTSNAFSQVVSSNSNSGASCAVPYTLTASWFDLTTNPPTPLTPVFGTILYLNPGACMLRAGANTLSVNGGPAIGIYQMSDAQNLSAPYGCCAGDILPVFYRADLPGWLVMNR